ncbi:MAG TPA: Rieske (2Fe-2S) protein [Thermoleophilaceae bacterium]|nr:Rieske (2Fe-2S) protein [Thermoleophilaceae bacterium]
MTIEKQNGGVAPLATLVDSLESAAVLDTPAKKVGKSVRGKIEPGPVKDALSGTWLGHAIHPLLTDVVIGAFMSANLLDLLGGDRDGRASERLIALGLAAYAPTAITGVSDWADSEVGSESVRRVGLVHAAANATAASLYAASLVARLRGSRGRGKALALAGAGVLGGGGFLGGHLSFVRGVGMNQTEFDAGPSDWAPALPASELVEREPKRVIVGDTPVMLVRHSHGIHAIHDRCSHRGCPLSKSEIEGDTVTCFCHGSRFDLSDGSVLRGPATTPQPAYDAREVAGQIEIRLRSA